MMILEGPGQARRSDPKTSIEAAKLITAHAGTARVRLLVAHYDHPNGLTDEEACEYAGLSLASEYATRCSELMRCDLLRDTGDVRNSASGANRMVRRITGYGKDIVEERGDR